VDKEFLVLRSDNKVVARLNPFTSHDQFWAVGVGPTGIMPYRLKRGGEGTMDLWKDGHVKTVGRFTSRSIEYGSRCAFNSKAGELSFTCSRGNRHWTTVRKPVHTGRLIGAT
jgi:hypothetical protein